MAKVLTDESNYEDIADAIRDKSGTLDAYRPSEMAEAIEAIPSGYGIVNVEVSGDTMVFTENDDPTPTITGVKGVKGANESTYREGYVNITPEDIGAVTDVQTQTLTQVEQSIAAGAILPLTFYFTVPSGYKIVGACDASHLATAFGVPIRILDSGTVVMDYFSPAGINSKDLSAKAFYVKVAV